MVDEPETEVLIELGTQVLLHVCSVPIRLPGEGFAIPQVFDQYHPALELAALDRSTGVGREQRAQQYGPLRVDRLSLRPPELIPYVEVRPRHLMPVIGLSSQEVAVVHLDLVAGCYEVQYLGIGHADGDDGAHDLAKRYFHTCSGACQDHQIPTQEIHFRRSVRELDGNGYLRCSIL